MDYQEFLDYVKENILDYLKQSRITADTSNEVIFDEKEYEVLSQKIMKNNGITLDAITIYQEGQYVSPNIYLNAYYDQYKMGKPLDCIMNQLIQEYEDKMEEAGTLQVDNVYDLDKVRDKIVFRLVNYERNRKELLLCPHKRFLNFAVTFRYLASKDAMGIASSIISHKEFAAWNIELDELYDIAKSNTMRLFPWKIESLAKMITSCMCGDLSNALSEDAYEDMMNMVEQDCGIQMFVLSNDVGINGATCVLYDQVLYEFSMAHECNLYVLPSSVHEVILIPAEEDTDPQFLLELVSNANKSSVGLIDLLSDEIYYYDRNINEIQIYEE